MSDSVRSQRWQPTRLFCPWDSPGKNTGVSCHFLLQCMRVKSESEVAQSCLTSRSHSPPIFPNLSNLIEFVWHQWLSYTALSEKAMAPHSSTLAWKIPLMEETGRLQSPEAWIQVSISTFPFHSHALEKEMATHSSVLAWRIPETGEPGGLLSMGSHRVGHD